MLLLRIAISVMALSIINSVVNGEGLERLAVIDLEPRHGLEESLALALSDIVRDEIHSHGKYVVMSQEDLRQVVSREQLLQAMGCDEGSSCLVDFGRAIGTRYMLVGSISKIGKTYSVNLRMLDTKGENAGLVHRVSELCKCSEDDLIATVQRLAANIIGEKTKDQIESENQLSKNTRKTQQEKPAAKKRDRVFKDPITGMEFILVIGDCYQMGQTSAEKDYVIRVRGLEKYNKFSKDELPSHKVCVDDFYMGKYEVTNRQFRHFKPSHHSQVYKGENLDGDDHPVVNVSWNDAADFANWLSEKSGINYRLPYEAEWEYAARGKTTSIKFWGNSPEEACRYSNVYDRTSHKRMNYSWQHHNCDDTYVATAPVGSLLPNTFGLFDMLGNVWEFCHDFYDENYYGKSPMDNPAGPTSGSHHVARGGGWNNDPGRIRAADRVRTKPDYLGGFLGFRLIRPVE